MQLHRVLVHQGQLVQVPAIDREQHQKELEERHQKDLQEERTKVEQLRREVEFLLVRVRSLSDITHRQQIDIERMQGTSAFSSIRRRGQCQGAQHAGDLAPEDIW